jgi:hypothetical protein
MSEHGHFFWKLPIAPDSQQIAITLLYVFIYSCTDVLCVLWTRLGQLLVKAATREEGIRRKLQIWLIVVSLVSSSHFKSRQVDTGGGGGGGGQRILPLCASG